MKRSPETIKAEIQRVLEEREAHRVAIRDCAVKLRNLKAALGRALLASNLGAPPVPKSPFDVDLDDDYPDDRL